MRTMTAIVADSKRLELTEDVSIPAGTRVRIQIEEDEAVDDYAARLARYYEDCTEEALEEERALAERPETANDPLATW